MRHEKLSPALAAAADAFARAGRAGLAPHGDRLGLVSVSPAARPARAVVFLHVEAGADLEHLADLGVQLNGGEGPVRTGIVPLERLGALSEDPAVHRIVASTRLRLLLDVATAAVHVPAFRSRTGRRGKGVVIGIVDSGIEVGHDSFAGRIHRVWDQTLNGQGVPEGRYGVELKGSSLSLSRDTNGHGTHVAGIAAGADDTYEGVAPDARLVVVKTDLLSAHIADGIRYVFRVAGALRQPAVVNLSLGGQDDSHDGKDSLSAVIDEVVGPGRIVCCAAGNEGNDNIHARVKVPRGGTRTIPCAIAAPATDSPPQVVSFTGWYPGVDRLSVAVVSPSEVQTPFQPIITKGSPVRTHSLADGLVRITTPGPDPTNGDHAFLVQIEPAPVPEGSHRRGSWRLRVKGTKVTDGNLDVWSVDPVAAQLTGKAVSDSMKVGSPGAATGAITVASFTTRTAWEDIFGQPHEAGLELDDISDFSSEGPRRDGGQKPDLAAPGAMIASALSVHSPVLPELLMDSLHVLMAGTSMATPFISGIVALLLEGDRTLGPEQVRAVLRSHSAFPGGGPGRWDPKWGAGLLDARDL
ncbi:MAG: S8 family serine peptidase [Acidimicrobiales bacterium]